jgi:hypothetical protein
MFVGTEEFAMRDENLTVSPNPAHDVVKINFESASNDPVFIELNDLSGRRIKSATFPTSNLSASSIDIEVNDLDPGMYLLVLRQRDATLTRRILVE